MKKILILASALIVLTALIAQAQENADYYSRNDFLLAPAGSFEEGLVGFANPANLAALESMENRFFWSSDGVDASSFKNWGFFFGVPHFGFSVVRQESGVSHVTDYRLSIAGGSPKRMLGIAYSWASGDRSLFGRERMLSVGALKRPCKFASLGLIGNFSLESDWNEGIAEIGIRPLGTSLLTLFADGAIQRDMRFSDAPWSAGAAVQVAPGINLVGRYFNSEAFTVGVTINFGFQGFGGQSHYDCDQKHSGYSYHIRFGGMRPSIFPEMIDKNRRYASIDMKGKVDYLKYVLFDERTLRLIDILNDIRAAVDDSRVSAIAMNLSSTRVLPEHAWEIREELKAAQQAGKKVIIFIDNADMRSYHLASVADRVVMDPEGFIELYGFAMGRTFFKGTLEKLGLGFDEWRFFKYKSAAEALSRDKMSDADREQRQDYVDDQYELVRDDVCQSRSLSPEQFDNLIDEHGFFMPGKAVEMGLVDTLARWSDKDKILKNLTGRKLRGISAKKLEPNALPQKNWGQNPKITVVYGLGVCAMDSGIKARWLERVFLKLEKDRSVKAVVFRVDSPGGDGMASDLVAEALKKCAKKKPVIVSQGQVAGSGGYWISMYGTEILAGPNTVTGSIGVIGGWIYDKGIGEKLGMTSDFVKRGKHADLGSGITIPFINQTVPARNLDSEERGEVETIIRAFYNQFVEKVAGGRNMPVDEVRKIAEGHFYSGIDGEEIGLVDEIGGLMTALAVAREKAGIRVDEEIETVEIPKRKGWYHFRPKMSPIPFELEDNDVYRYIRMATEQPGRPLPMLIPGTYPSWEE